MIKLTKKVINHSGRLMINIPKDVGIAYGIVTGKPSKKTGNGIYP